MVVEEILSEFREQFISDMDVNMVVMELLNKDIISDGVRESIERAGGPRHRSAILHEHLKRTCTEEAFKTVCDIIASIQGNPKMSALGNHMQRSLESGVCVCVCVRVCVCMHVYMHAFVLFLPLIATFHCIHVCAGVSSRGRHEVMAPLTNAATHGSIQSQQTGIAGHGMYDVNSIV